MTTHEVDYKTLTARQLAEYLDRIVAEGGKLITVQQVGTFSSLFMYMIVYSKTALGLGAVSQESI